MPFTYGVRFAIAVCACAFVMACDDEPVGLDDVVATLEITPASLTFDALGDQRALSVVARDAAGTTVSEVTLAWTSSDPTVADVDGAGTVTSAGNGSAVITVRVVDAGEATETVEVTVQQVAASVAIQGLGSPVFERDTVRLSVQAADANGNAIPASAVDPATLVWSSSDPSIASVDAQGLLTGNAMGPVTILVSQTAGGPPAAALVAAGADSAEVDVLVSFTALEIGAFHSCGITAADRAYCWGSNGEGRLGSISPTDSAPRNRHVPVRGNRAYRSVHAGTAHTCAVDSTRVGYCWGKNDWGQLGSGVSNLSANVDPTPIAGTLVFAAIDIGWRNTCGVTDAGLLYCWGLGTSGRLGNADTAAVLAPALAAGAATYTALALGEHHGCAIAADSLLYCWGDNSANQLGASTGELCTDIFANTTACATAPTRVSDTLRFVSVSAGRSHTCGVIANGTALCWGEGTEGRLGTGTTDSVAVPTPVAGGLAFSSVSAGIAHTCGVATDGTAYCWGSNIVGQVGDGTMSDRSAPVAVSLATPVSSVTAGASHSCALTTDGIAWCWGFNMSGQLGDGVNVTSLTPVVVLGQNGTP